MVLKLFTTVMLLVTVGLLIFRPEIVGSIPHRPAKRAEALAYSERALAFTGMLILSLTCAGVGSIVLVRRANEEYRRMSVENMQALIDGTLEYHKKKTVESPENDQ